MYEGDIFNTSIVKEKFYNVIVTNLTVGNTRINMDCTEVSQSCRRSGAIAMTSEGVTCVQLEMC